MYSLRPYQQKAVDFTLERFQKDKEPMLMVAPTGAGKTWIIAEIAKRWNGKVLVLTVSKELCQQDAEKLEIVCGKDQTGIYSASWGKKEIKDITVATIQSAYKHPELWDEFSLIVVDEVEATSLDGMLGELVKGKRVLGLTATPYASVGSRRGKWYTTKLWPMHKVKSKKYGWYWKPCEYVISEEELLKDGYLSPLKIYSTPERCGILRLASNGSEYEKESIEKWVNQILFRIMQVMAGAEGKGWVNSGIVFMPSVESCEALEKICQDFHINAKAVHNKTPANVRDKIISDHKAGKLRWLINQGIATRGFDNPQVDCLVIARPTASLRLHRQMIGRGVRVAPGKFGCTVLDLTENCKRWGGLLDVKMGKKGWADIILLRGEDISGMEVSKIDLTRSKKNGTRTATNTDHDNAGNL